MTADAKFLELQDQILENKMSRIDLMNYVNTSSRKYRAFVYRNHSFELVEHTIGAYLDYAGINVEFTYSDYDDSMTFLNLDLTADLIVLWIDFTRYNTQTVQKFAEERLDYLSSVTHKPILFVPFGKKISAKQTNVITYDIAPIQNKLNEKFLDERLEKFSGTKISMSALGMIARDLGLKYIPACVMPTMKALVFDLDNTLYEGVLGEDGISRVCLTEAHKILQQKIADFSKQGFFVCVASKNEEKDVIELFKKRQDFPLKLENITKICASWNEKSESIGQIKEFLNIGVDDMLFVDDNLGEIARVKEAFPKINVIHAKSDALKTLELLCSFPRMLKLNVSYEDSIRKADTQSNEKREELKKNLSPKEFFRTLDIHLTYRKSDKSGIKRFAELSNKTNQFICSYRRYTEGDVECFTGDPKYLTVSVFFKDKLSDSGMIGGLVFKEESDYVCVEECFVSCRALGRGVDEFLILKPIEIALEHFSKQKLLFKFTRGERNKPAELFVDTFLKPYKNQIGIFDHKTTDDFVTITVEEGIRQ